MSQYITPVAELVVIKHKIPAYKLIPNSTATNKPLLIYKSVFAAQCSASDIEKHLSETGAVLPQWRYTMYSQSHFHSTTHEVLAIAKGSAKLCFGHEDNSGCTINTVCKGDVVIIPAGISHRLMEDIDGGFLMVGSYPKHSKQWDMCYGHESETTTIETIKSLDWFARDPIYGDEGPTLDV